MVRKPFSMGVAVNKFSIPHFYRVFLNAESLLVLKSYIQTSLSTGQNWRLIIEEDDIRFDSTVWALRCILTYFSTFVA